MRQIREEGTEAWLIMSRSSCGGDVSGGVEMVTWWWWSSCLQLRESVDADGEEGGVQDTHHRLARLGEEARQVVHADHLHIEAGRQAGRRKRLEGGQGLSGSRE